MHQIKLVHAVRTIVDLPCEISTLTKVEKIHREKCEQFNELLKKDDQIESITASNAYIQQGDKVIIAETSFKTIRNNQ